MRENVNSYNQKALEVRKGKVESRLKGNETNGRLPSIW